MADNDNDRDAWYWIERCYPWITIACIALSAGAWVYAVVSLVERMKQW